MKKQSLNIITVGYAKRALEIGSREYEKMQRYATVVGELHVIVLTRKQDKLPTTLQTGNLFLYGTNTNTKIGMLYKAWRIGRAIVRSAPRTPWVVSAQDPFETSVVCSGIAFGNPATHHVQIHGDVFNPLSSSESLLQRLRTIYAKMLVRRVSGIRVVSERIKQSLLTLGVSPAVITVLPIQADLQSFLEVGRQRQYEVTDRCAFLYLGRFSPEKNIPVLLEAFAAVAADFPAATLTLVGSGPEETRIQRDISAHHLVDQVQILPWTNNVPALMAAQQVLCLSSKHEGWAMVLLEAAAAGMPVITTDVGCAGEAITDGVQGRVVPVSDAKAFSAALRQYLSRPTEIATHGRAGQKLAAEFVLPESEYLARMVESWASALK